MVAVVGVLFGSARQIGSGPELALELNQQDPLVTGPIDIYVTITNVTGLAAF
jgi:hypothetical protein